MFKIRKLLFHGGVYQESSMKKIGLKGEKVHITEGRKPGNHSRIDFQPIEVTYINKVTP